MFKLIQIYLCSKSDYYKIIPCNSWLWIKIDYEIDYEFNIQKTV